MIGVVLGEIRVPVGGMLGTVGVEEFEPDVPFENPVGEDMSVDVAFERLPSMAAVVVGDRIVVAASRLDVDNVDTVTLLPITEDSKVCPAMFETRAARKKKV